MAEAQIDRIGMIYLFIEQHPGCTYTTIARGLNLTYGIVRNHIVTMEYNGFLLSEDEKSRLYPVCKDAPCRQ